MALSTEAPPARSTWLRRAFTRCCCGPCSPTCQVDQVEAGPLGGGGPVLIHHRALHAAGDDAVTAGGLAVGPRLTHAAVLQAPLQQLQSLLRCTGASDLVPRMHTGGWLNSCRASCKSFQRRPVEPVIRQCSSDHAPAGAGPAVAHSQGRKTRGARLHTSVLRSPRQQLRGQAGHGRGVTGTHHKQAVVRRTAADTSTS